jgi:Na+/proline symporter
VVGSGFVVLAQFLLFLLIGVGLYVVWQQGAMELPAEPSLRNDEVFGHFIVHHLPAGVIGVLIAAVLSAAMSTLSSSLNSSANAAVNDFYRPLRPGRDERHYLRVSKGMTTVWGAAQVGVALFAASALQRSVIDSVLAIAGFTTGMVLGLFLLGRMRRPVGSSAALAGLAAGFLTVLGVMLGTAIAWLWYAPIGTLMTLGVAILLDRAILANGPPTDRSPQPGLGRPGPA